MPYSLDITLTEFKYLTVTAKLCEGSAKLKNPYVTAVPVYSIAVLHEPAVGGLLYDETGKSQSLVFFEPNETIRRRTFVARSVPGAGVVQDIYLYPMMPQSIPVSPDGVNAVFALPFGSQSKSYNTAEDPSKYLITLFNTGEPDSSGVTTPSVLAQGYLVLPPAVGTGSGGGGGGGGGSGGGSAAAAPTICSVTLS